MSVLAGKSAAERIAFAFERHTEVHRAGVELRCELTPEQFDAAIPRAREIVAEDGLGYLVPVYEREGWWTVHPTDRIMAIALHEGVKRNEGEAARNAFCFKGHPRFGDIAEALASNRRGSTHLVEASLPERSIDPKLDYVIERVDAAVAGGKGYVLRESERAAA